MKNTFLYPKRMIELIVSMCFVGFSFMNYAQEIIVDLNPDVVITASSPDFSLDIDNDFTVDFLFRVQVMSGDTVLGGQPSTFDGASSILEGLNGQPAGETANSVFTLTNFPEGEVVSASNEFGVDTSYSLGINLLIDAGIGIFPYVYGSFLGVSNQFLGVSFMSGGNKHYGWVELSVSSGADTIVVHSYGYNQMADEMVDVGGLGGVQSNSADKVQIWNNSEAINIHVSPALIGKSFKIVSSEGRNSYSGMFNNLENKLTKNSLSSGVYTLMIDTYLGQISKRFYIH